MSKKTKSEQSRRPEVEPHEPESAVGEERPDRRRAEQQNSVNEQSTDMALEADEDTVYESAETVVHDVEELRRQCDDAKDRALRFQAELDNFRKRIARQMEEERRYANIPLIRDLLPVWDNMGRAIEAAEKNHEVAGLLEGFNMVTRQLEDVLKRHDCTPIDAMGQPFDPHLHEAISHLPSEEHPANTVLHVAQTGFRLHDRVVRPSQVVVSAGPPENQAEQKTGT